MIKRIPFRPKEEIDVALDANAEWIANENNIFGKALYPVTWIDIEERVHRLGATYEDLEAIAAAVDMNEEETEEWISLAESIPLSDEIAKYIRGQLEGRA